MDGTMAAAEARRPRRPIAWPVTLITFGALLLLSNLGYLTLSFWSTLWRFWPMILILVGIELLFGRRHPWIGAAIAIAVVAAAIALVLVLSGPSAQPLFSAGPATPRYVTEELGNLQSATVDIDFGAGELSIGSLPQGSNRFVEVEAAARNSGSRLRKSFSGSNGRGYLTLRSDGGPWTPFEGDIVENWKVNLAQGLPLDLRLKTGASQSTVDLSDLTIRDLRVEVGAAAAEIILPKEGSTRAFVKAGVADVQIEVPEGVAAKIHTKVGLGSINVAQERFPNRGSYYMSNDYDSSDNRVELEIDSGVASVTVR